MERLIEERFAASTGRTGRYLLPGACAYVAPHAGLDYSGTVAAAVYRSLQEQKPERVVLLGFPHRGGLSGVAAPDVDSIATPLGAVTLDGAFGDFPRLDEALLCDHSCEIQLPFLQKAAPGARLTMLYIGRMGVSQRRAAAAQLAAQWHPGVVFLASSDFTHYGRSFGYVPFPCDGAVGERLHELDHTCIEAASSFDSELFLETVTARGATICGTGPIALLLDTLHHLSANGIYQTVLDYQTSGEITGDRRTSVSYAALGYYPRASFDLPADDRVALLDAAARTLAHLRQTGQRRVMLAGGSALLGVRRGAFVSLHRGEELLGCVGNPAGCKPLREEVSDLTLAAALDDPRFRPAASQHGPIDIELSVLTPFRRIRGPEGFEVGRHGGFLRLGERSGLLLPQVANRHEWTVEDFLKALARKSGLPPRAWRDIAARLDVFEAQAFAL